MRDASTRVLTGATLLVVIWGVVYWAWQPGGGDVVAFAALDVDPRVAAGPGVVVDPLATPTPPTQDADQPVRPPANERRAEPPAQPVTRVVPERVEPPAFREYTVRAGDTLGSIAAREFGSSARWSAIARSNPRIDPNALKVGMVIRLPVDPDNIQGRVVGGGGAPAGADDRPADAPDALEYRVASGDTLSGIAEKFYGSTRYVEFLYLANRDRLSTRNALKVGQTLRIPPKPAEE